MPLRPRPPLARTAEAFVVLLLLGLAILCVPQAWAEDAETIQGAAFSGEIGSLQQIAERCRVDVAACEARGLPETQQVSGGPAGSFKVSWIWLQEALAAAKTASATDRAQAMRTAEDHLSVLAAQAAATTKAPNFGKAREAANTALAREEFRTAVEGPSWFDRVLARLQDAVLGFFFGVGRLSQRAPWLPALIEWSCFGLAAAGLLWFVRQSLTRQALRISLSEGALLASRGGRDAADWARLAEEHALAQAWREAVHCLYWAAIALMESRRAWKPNPTRTPREYVRLLPPGSEAQRALRELTRQFEQVWYGAADANASQYEAARESFRALEAAKPERQAELSQETNKSLAAAGGL